jgi:hypothetical protein
MSTEAIPADTASTIRSRCWKGLDTRAVRADSTCKRNAEAFKLISGTHLVSLFVRLDFRFSLGKCQAEGENQACLKFAPCRTESGRSWLFDAVFGVLIVST